MREIVSDARIAELHVWVMQQAELAIQGRPKRQLQRDYNDLASLLQHLRAQQTKPEVNLQGVAYDKVWCRVVEKKDSITHSITIERNGEQWKSFIFENIDASDLRDLLFSIVNHDRLMYGSKKRKSQPVPDGVDAEELQGEIMELYDKYPERGIFEGYLHLWLGIYFLPTPEETNQDCEEKK